MPIATRTTETLGEAAQAVASDRGARYFGGGTLLMRAVNEGSVAFGTLVRARDRALGEIRPLGGRIEIGAGVTMARILASRELAFLHPAAKAVGGPAVRVAATVGGNLFAPPPYGDLATALLALEGIAKVQTGLGGARDLPLEELFAAMGRETMVVGAVSILRPSGPDAFRFRKVARVRPKGLAVMTIAAHLPQTSGRIAGARIAFGAMGPHPVRAKAAERALEGRALDAAGVAAAVAVAAEGTAPADDPVASAWYRREVAPVYLRRLLLGEPD